MKKLFLTVILLLNLFCVNAQNISVNYTKGFLPSDNILFSNGKVTPQTVEQITLGYSQSIAKSNFHVNIAASVAANKPPLPVPPYPCPECTLKVSSKKISEGAIIGFLHPQSTSVNLLTGLGYTIPHKAGSRLTVSLNVDGGVAINSDQEVQATYKGIVEAYIPFEKYQPIINPSLKMKIGLTNWLGINLGGGYSNIGGVSLITGLNLSPFRRKD
jgi:hypothetical protein